MKLHTIIGLFICSGLLLTGGAGVVVGYYYNSQKQTMTTEDGEVVEQDIYLDMLPGQQKDFNIEVDFDWYSNANTSLWFTDVDEYSAKYVSVSARQDDKLLFVKEDGTNIYEIKNLDKENALKDKTFIKEDGENFTLTFYLSNEVVEPELDMQFTFHMSFIKTM
ncbi:MAG: hypothetical protein J5511_01325 [Bacilli bacterium]|nr:hypothetical protein [Bacilli bacterium]